VLNGAALRLVSVVQGRREGEPEVGHHGARVDEVEQVVGAGRPHDRRVAVGAVVQDDDRGVVGGVLDVDERRHLLEVVALPDLAALQVGVDDVAAVGADPEHHPARLLDHDLDPVVGEQDVAQLAARERAVDQLGRRADDRRPRGERGTREGTRFGGRVHDLEEPIGVAEDLPAGRAPEADAVGVAADDGEGEGPIRAGVRRHHVERAVDAADEDFEVEDPARGLHDRRPLHGAARGGVRVPEAGGERPPARRGERERLLGG
jgi:hypothetical protein